MSQKLQQNSRFQTPSKTIKIQDFYNPEMNYSSKFEEGMFLKILIKDVDEEGGNYRINGQQYPKILGLSCDIFVNSVLEQRVKYYNQKVLQQLGQQNTIVPKEVTLFLAKDDKIQFRIFDCTQQQNNIKSSYEGCQLQQNADFNIQDIEKQLGEKILDYSFFQQFLNDKSYKWISFPRLVPSIISSEKRKMGYIIDPEEKPSKKLQQNGEILTKVLFEFERISLKTLSPMKVKIEQGLEHYQDPLDENHPAVLNRITDILTDINCLKAFSNYQLISCEQQNQNEQQLKFYQKCTKIQSYLLNLQQALYNKNSQIINSNKSQNTPIKLNKNEIVLIQNFISPEKSKNSSIQPSNNSNSIDSREFTEINKFQRQNEENFTNQQDGKEERYIINEPQQSNKYTNNQQVSSNKKQNQIQLNFDTQTQTYLFSSLENNFSSKKIQQQEGSNQKFQKPINVQLEKTSYDEICDDLQKIQSDVVQMYDQLHQARYLRDYIQQQSSNLEDELTKQNLNDKQEKNEKLHKIINQYTDKIKQNSIIDSNIDTKISILYGLQEKLLEEAKVYSEELENLLKKEQQLEKKANRIKQSNELIQIDLKNINEAKDKMKKFNVNFETPQNFKDKFQKTDLKTKEMQTVFDKMYEQKLENLKLEEFKNQLKKLKAIKEEQKKGYKIFCEVENPQDISVNQYVRKFMQINGREIPHNQWKIEKDNQSFVQNQIEEDEENEDYIQQNDYNNIGLNNINQDISLEIRKKNISEINQDLNNNNNDITQFSALQNSQQYNFEQNNQIYQEIKERKSAISNLLNTIYNL
ncbi:hypothetical protein ABPG72_016642 [Tetrahymena utriculariae]